MPEYITKEELYEILDERFDIRQDIETLRRDVSDLKVEVSTIKVELKRVEETLRTEIRRLDEKFDGLKQTLNLHLTLILLLLGAIISGLVKLIFFP
jgi:predicted nuclease with TOPRIM domain